jgi:hypothetical protein
MAIFNKGFSDYDDYEKDINDQQVADADTGTIGPVFPYKKGIRFLKSSPSYKKYYNNINDNDRSEGMLVPSLSMQRPNITPYIHTETKNVSFIKMQHLLERLGIENNSFFLVLYDRRLLNIDPYDQNLTMEQQLMVAQECKNNYWYFIREIARIPVPGAKLGIGGGVPYELNRGNLAMSFCLLNNYKFWVEIPRQMGKTFGMAAWYLWLQNFGTTASEFLYMNKSHDDAKNNLRRTKDIRDLIPEYLQFIKVTEEKGEKIIDNPDNIESIENKLTHNRIVTKPSATSKDRANNIGRGMTQPNQWFDEFAWLPWNIDIFDAATPANSKASEEAGKHGKPYGQAITTTPGDLESDCGKDAYAMQVDCAKFSEILYDWSPKKRAKYIQKNSRNNFLFIRFHWYQLGKDKDWFNNIVRESGFRWIKIRREYLLEWINASSKCIFEQDEIMELRNNVKQPISQAIFGYYALDVYEMPDPNFKSIISIDVATGVAKDSSSITIINSRTFMPIAHFNSAAIDITELTKFIIEIATKFCPNCVIIPEANGPGAGLISNLKHSPVRRNLYFEYRKPGNQTDDKYKDGFIQVDSKNKVSYGVTNTEIVRNEIIELLYILVKKHKKKFIIDKIVSEVSTLIQTKSGKVEHDSNCHDDSIFSWLIGMWALIYGKNIQRFGVFKFELNEADPEELKKRAEEAKRKHAEFMQFESIVSNTDPIEQESSESYKLMQENQKKDMKEYFKETEKERQQYKDEEDPNSPINSQQYNFDAAFFNMLNK